jgi:hypothetical protein
LWWLLRRGDVPAHHGIGDAEHALLMPAPARSRGGRRSATRAWSGRIVSEPCRDERGRASRVAAEKALRRAWAVPPGTRGQA